MVFIIIDHVICIVPFEAFNNAVVWQPSFWGELKTRLLGGTDFLTLFQDVRALSSAGTINYSKT